ncbi:OadG family protein [Candidatus Epulonipiscium viviparus]|uniref:OadG family protein n=1 Tax=Candidatus Epulonipiscium viviparus TaxID=420336 RepID=UPI00273807E3|nr:OadG family protein [Candidatus Epulopiscium viviparus]
MSAFLAGLNTFVIGVCIVFVALVLLIVLINVSGKLIANLENKKQSPAETAVERVTVDTKKVEPVVVEDELEIVAAISAVIALSLGTTTDKLVVRSLKRVR